jgi:hypothetical protein
MKNYSPIAQLVELRRLVTVNPCSLIKMKNYSPIAQLVERWTVNPCVTGSSPVWGATLQNELLHTQ